MFTKHETTGMLFKHRVSVWQLNLLHNITSFTELCKTQFSEIIHTENKYICFSSDHNITPGINVAIKT